MKFDFTRDEYDYLRNKAMLNEELTLIFEMKIKGRSNVEIADKLNISERTLSRRINKLKNKIRRVL